MFLRRHNAWAVRPLSNMHMLCMWETLTRQAMKHCARKITCAGTWHCVRVWCLVYTPLLTKESTLHVSENTSSPLNKNCRSFHDEDFHHEAACQLEDEELVDGWSYHSQTVLVCDMLRTLFGPSKLLTSSLSNLILGVDSGVAVSMLLTQSLSSFRFLVIVSLIQRPVLLEARIFISAPLCRCLDFRVMFGCNRVAAGA